MAWEEYKPKPRGKAPIDFAGIVAKLAKPGDSVTVEYGSKQSCDTYLERIGLAAKAAKVTLKSVLMVGTGDNAGKFRLTVTRTT